MSSIAVYKRHSEAEIRAWISDFIPRLETWFSENPERKICKVDWLYGRSIDLRRDTYKARIASETEKLLMPATAA